jgi:hypothetical protein
MITSLYMKPVFLPRYVDWIIRKAIETELQPNNMNTKDGFSLSKSWKPLIHTL